MHALILLSALFGTHPLAALANTQYFPSLLIPLVSTNPFNPHGTQTTAEVSNTVYTEVSFDIPTPDDIGNDAPSCRINFHINTDARKNAPRELSGMPPYRFDVFPLKNSGTIDPSKDTWAVHPETGAPVATVELGKDGSVNVTGEWFKCDAWQFLLKPQGTRQLRFWWFELDYPVSEGGAHGITLEMHK